MKDLHIEYERSAKNLIEKPPESKRRSGFPTKRAMGIFLALSIGATICYSQVKSRTAAAPAAREATVGVRQGTTFTQGTAAFTGTLTPGDVTWSAGSTVFAISNGAIRGGAPVETRNADKPGPTLVQVKATAKIITARDSAPAGYIELARAMGVRPSAEEADLMVALRDLGYPVYDFEKVDEYLYRQALKQGTNVRWVWKAANLSAEKRLSEEGGTWRDRPGVGLVFNGMYKHRVPMATMTKMRDLAAKVPDAVFLISDYEVILPDPFLAVTTMDLLSANKIWIIDQWDEPGFGEAPKPVVVPTFAPRIIASAH